MVSFCTLVFVEPPSLNHSPNVETTGICMNQAAPNAHSPPDGPEATEEVHQKSVNWSNMEVVEAQTNESSVFFSLFCKK